MRNRRGQFDMAHALAAHFCQCDFNAALLTDNTFVLHALVLAAKTFVILHRSEDTRTEQTIFLRFERTVVDGFRLFHLAERPAVDLLG